MAIETERLQPGSGGVKDAVRRGWKRAASAAGGVLRNERLFEFLTYGPLIRFVTRTLQRRIVFSNLIGLGVLLCGVYYLSNNHAWLIDAKRESLRTQGEIIAAAIAANATIDTDQIVIDPDKLPDMDGGQIPFRDDGIAALELSIRPERVAPILRRLMQSTDNRARIYGRDGTLVADSATMIYKGQIVRSDLGDVDQEPLTPVKLKSAWTRLLAWLMRGDLSVYKEIGTANGTAYPEVRMALAGSTTPMLLVNEKGEQIVSVAVPIQRLKAVQGVLLLSTRPGEIDEVLSGERNFIVVLALLALATTLLASWLLARTIAGPMGRLSAAAETVSRSITARHELPNLTRRTDEVGQMAAAFRNMTAALYRRIEASERFAQDVAHELKNPLTAARSTAEALTYAKTEEKRAELVHQIQVELKRLNKLITDVSNASRLEAELALQEIEPVDIVEVVTGVVNVFRDVPASEGIQLKLVGVAGSGRKLMVSGHEGRLCQVVTNLVDNALSFSPEGGAVTVATRRVGDEIEISVEDQGPGIPADRLEAIFERFYSDRPQTDRTIGKNSGLGLSISREIVEAHGGRIWAENREGSGGRAADVCDQPELRDRRAPGVSGARFIVRLPAAAASRGAGFGRRV
ncbi:MAG: stimulus-sensing domain-containing protein [Hyphomicrobiaceae bacterium]